MDIVLQCVLVDDTAGCEIDGPSCFATARCCLGILPVVSLLPSFSISVNCSPFDPLVCSFPFLGECVSGMSVSNFGRMFISCFL